jgi:hypothetical protein
MISAHAKAEPLVPCLHPRQLQSCKKRSQGIAFDFYQVLLQHQAGAQGPVTLAYGPHGS